jgi:Ubiquitin 3 binding protein But2 C-terminal domain
MFFLLHILAFAVGVVPFRSPAGFKGAAEFILNGPAECPTDISGGRFQFPHLIIPTSKSEPDKAFRTFYNGLISPNWTTYFKFDLPVDYGGACAVLFQFPYASDLAPSAGTYNFSGTEAEDGQNGGIDFKSHAGYVDENTTWNTAPPVFEDFGKILVIPGNNYTIIAGYCSPVYPFIISASSVGNVTLEYMQNYSPQAIGLYVVPCWVGSSSATTVRAAGGAQLPCSFLNSV